MLTRHTASGPPARTIRTLAACAATLWLAACAPVLAAGAGAGCAVSANDLPADAQPAPLDTPAWHQQDDALRQVLARTDLSQVRLLFVGDSILANWQGFIFDKFYATRFPLNLGLRGDTTRGVLYRLARSPLGDALRPQLVVVLIGTNNLYVGADPRHVAAGIGAVVRLIRTRSPTSRVLLVGLLPRGGAPNDPLRVLTGEVNALVHACDDGRHVQYVEPGDMLTDGAGQLSPQIAFDYLHPTWLGYAILGAGLEPAVHRAVDPR